MSLSNITSVTPTIVKASSGGTKANNYRDATVINDSESYSTNTLEANVTVT